MALRGQKNTRFFRRCQTPFFTQWRESNPHGPLELQNKLNSIGISLTADHIPLSDEDGSEIRVKLFASTPEEAHLLPLLSPERSLSDANLSAILLRDAEVNSLPRLKCGLLSDSYSTLEDFTNAAKEVFTRERAPQAALAVTQPQPNSEKDPVLEEYEHNPNIRAVVSCIHDGTVVMSAWRALCTRARIITFLYRFYNHES